MYILFWLKYVLLLLMILFKQNSEKNFSQLFGNLKNTIMSIVLSPFSTMREITVPEFNESI